MKQQLYRQLMFPMISSDYDLERRTENDNEKRGQTIVKPT